MVNGSPSFAHPNGNKPFLSTRVSSFVKSKTSSNLNSTANSTNNSNETNSRQRILGYANGKKSFSRVSSSTIGNNKNGNIDEFSDFNDDAYMSFNNSGYSAISNENSSHAKPLASFKASKPKSGTSLTSLMALSSEDVNSKSNELMMKKYELDSSYMDQSILMNKISPSEYAAHVLEKAKKYLNESNKYLESDNT
jgi:hypothetical protein